MLIIKTALLFFTLWQNVPSDCFDLSSNTAVVKKEGVEEYIDSIPIIVDGYTDLVKLSQIFVDTSLFIEAVLSSKSISLLIVGPPKWGKTVNIDMLKTFLEIQVDHEGNESPKRRTTGYRLFKLGEITLCDDTVEKLDNHLLISKEKDIMEDYLGKVPVVHIDFKDANGDNFTAIKQGLKQAIGRAFQQHNYMINVLSKVKPARPSDVEEFEKYLNNEGDLTRGGGIPFLCKVLYHHFKRESFIIIDNYDLPFINALGVRHLLRDTDGLANLLKTIDSLIGYIFMNGQHVSKGVVVGGFQLEHPPGIRKWKNYAIHDLTIKEDYICEFFGLREKDVEVLLNEHGITDKPRKDATRWLNGYASFLSGSDFYHPFFLVNFLQVKKVPTYWKMSEQDENVVEQYIKTRGNETNQILRLLSGKTIKVDNDAIMGIEEMAYFENYTAPVTNKDIAWYLFRRGYLTAKLSSDSSKEKHVYKVHVPNNQIRFIFSNWMICYYRQRFQVNEKFIEYATEKMLEFFQNSIKTVNYFENAFENLYKAIAAYRHSLKKLKLDPRRFKNRIILPEMFYYIAMKLQCMTMFELDVYYEKAAGPNLMIINRRTQSGAIMEFECTDRPVDEVLKQALEFERTFYKMRSIEVMQFVGVALTTRKTIVVARKIIKRV